jgi:hypothetical protein
MAAAADAECVRTMGDAPAVGLRERAGAAEVHIPADAVVVDVDVPRLSIAPEDLECARSRGGALSGGGVDGSSGELSAVSGLEETERREVKDVKRGRI